MIQIIIQLVLLISLSKTKAASISLPNYPDSCGGVPIPYPFGIGPNCSLSETFELSCKSINGTSPPYRRDYLFLNINISSGQALVNMPISSQCYNSTTNSDDYKNWEVDLLHITDFRFNHEKNMIVVIRCDTLAYTRCFSDNNNSYLGGCVSGCDSLESLSDGSCSGIGCCQTSIPKGINYIELWFDENFNNSKVYNFNPCSYAMLTEAGFMFNTSHITTDQLLRQNTSAVIDWAIGNTTCNTAQTNKSTYACRSIYSNCSDSSSGPGYLCNCMDGYQGNPYLDEGCQDIDECANQNQCSEPAKCHNLSGSYKCSCPFGWRKKHNNLRDCELNLTLVIGICGGIFALLFLGVGIYVAHERRVLSKVEEKYFQKHGG
ncbi:hypothetical protein LUZ63_013776 [Rhynchospora breviuscula]|uniref:EGF-like domain-containing protein n=1 Tax=Rhynchospora breviuscula TaxID=2022672 RepID=A0A9Q0HKJ0_9POAL|nr:hypothetical protein LUZ63_013776 [Rhynchospora breviuscula]